MAIDCMVRFKGSGKLGKIVVVVPSQNNPFRVIEKAKLKYDKIKIHGRWKGERLTLRDERSYIVACQYGKKVHLTWPRVSLLEKV